MILFGTHLPTNILDDPSVLKIAQRLERKFPDLKGLEKSAGFEGFASKAALVAKTLEPFAFLIRDVYDYNSISLQIITELTQALTEFDFLVSRNYCLMVCVLVALQMRINIVLAKITDSKKFFALYSAASELLTNGRSNPTYAPYCELLVSLGNHNRFFIDSFRPLQEVIGDILKQLVDSLSVGNDFSGLRSQGILNPLLAMPAVGLDVLSKKSLNAIKSISIYTELADYPTYCDCVMYCLIACPGLLFNPEFFDIFRLVGSCTLTARIHNGLVLNVHEEFSVISQIFPSKTEKYECPKGFSLKAALKDVAKLATKTCGLVHIARRAFLKEEVTTLTRVIGCIPGAVGPKFPQILAAASLARSEVLSYFRHLREETRKECKKHLVSAHYKTAASDLPPLLAELGNLTQCVRAGRNILIHYYVDYMNGPDASALEKVRESSIKV